MRLPHWQKAYPDIPWSAQYKSVNQDFIVTEELSFNLKSHQPASNNQSEHLYLYIEKNALSSYQILELLADYFEVEQNQLGYAGLKDKNAVTQQWFSIYLPGRFKSLDIEMLLGSQLVTAANSKNFAGQCRILKARWHSGKLRRGAITKNSFSIRLRSETEIPQALIERLKLISEKGFPNYFAKQRFGIEGQNIQYIEQWIEQKKSPQPKLDSILFSTARSLLFNHILEKRIALKNWNTAINGDYFMLNGSRTCFRTQLLDDQIIQRCDNNDIHPCSSLWGLGDLKVVGEAGKIEAEVFDQYQDYCDLLAENQLQIGYRAMRCLVEDLTWEKLNATDLKLDFALPSGSYATALLRELGAISEYKRV